MKADTYLKLFANFEDITQWVVDQFRDVVHTLHRSGPFSCTFSIAVIAKQVRFAVTAGIRCARLEGRKSISQNDMTFLPTLSLAVVPHGLGTTFTEPCVNLG